MSHTDIMSTKQDHPKSRGKVTNFLYSDGKGKRFQVNSDQVKWESKCDSYQPTDYEHPVVLKKPVWADPKFEDDKINYENIVMGEFLAGKRFSYEIKNLKTQVKTHEYLMACGKLEAISIFVSKTGW